MASACCPGDISNVPDNPPAARAEMQQIIRYGSSGFADVRALQVPSTLPIAVLIGTATPSGSSNGDFQLFKRLQVRHQSEWVMSSPAGLLLVSAQSGHQVMKDAPTLVLQAIRHVLAHVTPTQGP
jgi:hypothetical protein